MEGLFFIVLALTAFNIALLALGGVAWLLEKLWPDGVERLEEFLFR